MHHLSRRAHTGTILVRRVIFLCLVGIVLSLWTKAQETPFDLVIANGHIVDGTGSPWYSADVGIREGRIAAIGHLTALPRQRTIDGAGRIVAPGFIDMLGQSELSILSDPSVPSKIFQGITTEITGEGGSIAPLNERIIEADQQAYAHYHITPDWRTLGQYFLRLEKQGIGINLATYVGAGQIRRTVLGDEDIQPTPLQLDQMKSLVRQAMADGAMGLSSALIYTPGAYAKTEELIALASEAARFGGIYATHLRSEGDAIFPALDEAFRIGREARIPVEIWHLKVAGKANWGRMSEVIDRINAARGEGIDVGANTYAYPAWQNGLASYIPPWAHDGGEAKMTDRLKDPVLRARIRQEMNTPSPQWENQWASLPGPEAILICIVQNPSLRSLQGKTLAQIASLQHKDPLDALFDLLIEDHAFTGAVGFGMSESDIALALQQSWVSVDNDYEGTSPNGPFGTDHAHPRAYGTFPRILRKYVREEKKLTLEEAIRKFSALPAERMRLSDRGVLKTGLWADVVIFDQAKVKDVATFENPNQPSVGMDYVLVNGIPVIESGQATKSLPGKVLRGPGWRR